MHIDVCGIDVAGANKHVVVSLVRFLYPQRLAEREEQLRKETARLKAEKRGDELSYAAARSAAMAGAAPPKVGFTPFGQFVETKRRREQQLKRAQARPAEALALRLNVCLPKPLSQHPRRTHTRVAIGYIGG